MLAVSYKPLETAVLTEAKYLIRFKNEIGTDDWLMDLTRFTIQGAADSFIRSGLRIVAVHAKVGTAPITPDELRAAFKG